MKNRISAWIVLGLITLVAGLGLAITNEVTKKPIADQALAAEERAKKLVMPEADQFEEITLADGSTLFVAKANNEIIGYVGKAESKGYGGLIEVITGIKADGVITGINVGGSSFAETPGLGAKAKDDTFTAQFAGKLTPVRLGNPENDNAVDSITAATRTSNAVLGAVNAVAKQVKSYLNPDDGQPVPPAEGTSYAGEAVGFAGADNPVSVVVTVKDDGIISALTVGDERFSETDGYGAAALETEFSQQFVGKSVPVSIDTIDGISGATMTTKAVVDAINQAVESNNVVEIVTAKPEGTTYAGAADGFAGPANPVAIQATIKDDGTISALSIGDDLFNETEGYGAAALEPEFAEQFLGKTVPLVLEDVDGISGATITTNAVVSAINKAYENKNIIQLPGSMPEGKVYAGAAEGFAGPNNPLAVEVTINSEGSITALKIGDEKFEETEGYGAAALEAEFAEQFIGRTVPVSIDDIDGISGATLTTKAVVNAINIAYTEQNVISEGAPEVTARPSAEPSAVPDAVIVPDNAVTAVKDGYAGPVTVSAAFDENGKITFIKIGDETFQETRGFGLAALEKTFQDQFLGKFPPLSARKPDEAVTEFTIDGISGASVTTSAVLEALNELQASLFPQPEATPDAAILTTGDEIAVTKEGFMGPVTVKVTFLDDHSIAQIVIDVDQFSETAGYGADALEDSYTDQFDGKLPPLSLRLQNQAPSENTVENLINVDTATSATKTAQAIIDAVNEAFMLYTSQQQATATIQGFMGPVTVTVSFFEDGGIEKIEVHRENFSESAGYGDAALSEAFAAQFIGKQPPLSLRALNESVRADTVDNLVNIDTATSATKTAQAILDAVNEAYGMYRSKKEVTVTKQGFMGPVIVTVSFNEDGSVESVSINSESFQETPGYGTAVLTEEFAARFTGKTPPLFIRQNNEEIATNLVDNLSSIDTSTSATITMQAVIDAINEAFETRP